MYCMSSSFSFLSSINILVRADATEMLEVDKPTEDSEAAALLRHTLGDLLWRGTSFKSQWHSILRTFLLFNMLYFLSKQNVRMKQTGVIITNLIQRDISYEDQGGM